MANYQPHPHQPLAAQLSWNYHQQRKYDDYQQAWAKNEEDLQANRISRSVYEQRQAMIRAGISPLHQAQMQHWDMQDERAKQTMGEQAGHQAIMKQREAEFMTNPANLMKRIVVLPNHVDGRPTAYHLDKNGQLAMMDGEKDRLAHERAMEAKAKEHRDNLELKRQEREYAKADNSIKDHHAQYNAAVKLLTTKDNDNKSVPPSDEAVSEHLRKQNDHFEEMKAEKDRVAARKRVSDEWHKGIPNKKRAEDFENHPYFFKGYNGVEDYEKSLFAKHAAPPKPDYAGEARPFQGPDQSIALRPKPLLSPEDRVRTPEDIDVARAGVPDWQAGGFGDDPNMEPATPRHQWADLRGSDAPPAPDDQGSPVAGNAMPFRPPGIGEPVGPESFNPLDPVRAKAIMEAETARQQRETDRLAELRKITGVDDTAKTFEGIDAPNHAPAPVSDEEAARQQRISEAQASGFRN